MTLRVSNIFTTHIQTLLGTCRPTKFSSVTHLNLHITRNFGADTMRIYYVGLFGDFVQVYIELPNPFVFKCSRDQIWSFISDSQAQRKEATLPYVLYESAPRPVDHPKPLDQLHSQQPGF